MTIYNLIPVRSSLRPTTSTRPGRCQMDVGFGRVHVQTFALDWPSSDRRDEEILWSASAFVSEVGRFSNAHECEVARRMAFQTLFCSSLPFGWNGDGGSHVPSILLGGSHKKCGLICSFDQNKIMHLITTDGSILFVR